MQLRDYVQVCGQFWVGGDEGKVTGQGTGTRVWDGSGRVNLAGLSSIRPAYRFGL